MDDLTEFCSVGLLGVVVVVVGFDLLELELSVSFFALAVGFGSVSIVLSRSSAVPISNPMTAPSNFINFGLLKSLIKEDRIGISMIEKPTLYYSVAVASFSSTSLFLDLSSILVPLDWSLIE